MVTVKFLGCVAKGAQIADGAIVIHYIPRGDLHALDLQIDKVEQIQKDMLEELNATHADVRYIRSTVDALVRSDIAQDAAIHNGRITVEHGITKRYKEVSRFAHFYCAFENS